MYVIACEWWQGCMAWQAPCSRIEPSGVLPISVVSSVAWTQFGCLCCIPASKALVPLVDSFLVGAPCGVSAGPRSRPRVPRVPREHPRCRCGPRGRARGLGCRKSCGFGAFGPFANVPSERHRSAPHDRRARPSPSLPSSEPGPPGGAGIDKECYPVDPASSHILVSKIKPCMCKYELIQTVKLRMAH